VAFGRGFRRPARPDLSSFTLALYEGMVSSHLVLSGLSAHAPTTTSTPLGLLWTRRNTDAAINHGHYASIRLLGAEQDLANLGHFFPRCHRAFSARRTYQVL